MAALGPLVGTSLTIVTSIEPDSKRIRLMETEILEANPCEDGAPHGESKNRLYGPTKAARRASPIMLANGTPARAFTLHSWERLPCDRCELKILYRLARTPQPLEPMNAAGSGT